MLSSCSNLKTYSGGQELERHAALRAHFLCTRPSYCHVPQSLQPSEWGYVFGRIVGLVSMFSTDEESEV